MEENTNWNGLGMDYLAAFCEPELKELPRWQMENFHLKLITVHNGTFTPPCCKIMDRYTSIDLTNPIEIHSYRKQGLKLRWYQTFREDDTWFEANMEQTLRAEEASR